MSAKKAGKTRTKTPPKSSQKKGKQMVPAPAVRESNGGLLRVGNPGNAGGTGRPPSELRARLVGTFAERVSVIEDIADGKPVKRVRVALSAVLKHAACPKCGDALKPTGSPEDIVFVEMDGEVSASPGDRIRALDLAGKYGLGSAGMPMEVVREKLRTTIGLIRAELGSDLAAKIVGSMREIWA